MLATVDQPDFVRREEVELEPMLEEILMRWSGVAPRAWRLGSLAPGGCWLTPTVCGRPSTR